MATQPLLLGWASGIWRKQHRDAELQGGGRMHPSPGMGLYLETAVLGRNGDNAACGHSEAHFYICECVCASYSSAVQKLHLVIRAQLGNFLLARFCCGWLLGFSSPTLVGSGLWLGFLSGFNWSLGVCWCTCSTK